MVTSTEPRGNLMNIRNEMLYLNLLNEVRECGQKTEDRTGTGTLSVFGTQTHYDLQDGFPLLTTKKMFWKGIVHELLWMISGDTNIQYLQDNGVHIWDEWADEAGDLGPVYGAQWRAWGNYRMDQLEEVILSIQKNPFSRRHIVTAWNPDETEDMTLPPCHMMFQFNVDPKGFIDLQMYQRSADMFLGVPFNIASYSLLLGLVGVLTGYKPRNFIHTIGDAHIYLNHLDQVDEQLSRSPKPSPSVFITRKDTIDSFEFEDISLIDYYPYPTIKGEISV